MHCLTSKKIKNAFLWFPVFVVFAILPLITRYKLYDSRLSEFLWTPFDTTAIDFYLYWKQVAFEILTGVIFLLLCFFTGRRICRKQEKALLPETRIQRTQMIPLGIYFLFVLLSSLFSDYKYAAFTGSDGQFESFFVLAGYVLLVIYFLFLMQTEQDVRRLLFCLLTGATLLAVIGLLQYSGHNPFLWEWVQRLITPKGYLEACGPLESTFEEWRVSLFSYNPNYAGVLLALLSTFCYGLLLTEANWKRLLAELLLLIALFISLLGTGSKAGFLTFVVVAVCSLIFIRKKIKKHWYIALLLSLAVIVGGSLILQIKQIPLWSQIQQALTLEKSEPNPLQDMLTEPDGVYFTYRNISFSVAFDYTDGTFDFTVTEYPSKSTDKATATEIPLRISEDRKLYYLEREGLQDVSIRPGIINGVVPVFSIYLNNREWMFVKLESQDSPYFYMNEYLKLENLEEIERIGFEGYEHFATERGLLWSMTLPLMKDSLLLGSGANTFAFVYPQNNYKDLYYYTGEAAVSTRPHSMYLQTAVECGIPALIALLVFFGWYLVQSLRLYWKRSFETLSERVGLACFLAVAVYLACGLTNDSMITVAPVFWGILGIGIATNRRVDDV